MNYARSSPEAFIAEITPAMAKEMLATSTGNRKLRGWYVSQLASAMHRGEWRVTSQGIGFCTNGHLKDAHHRLSACIQSGVTIESLIVLGLRDDAYQVIDTGMMRTYGDRLDLDKRVAEVIRLGCQHVYSNARPSVDQIKPFIDAGFAKSVQSLVEYCGTSRRYYTSAPMKLAAVATVMNGGDCGYVYDQYRALANFDIECMSRSAQALVKQVQSNQICAGEAGDTLARGLKVFDKERAMLTKIQCSAADATTAIAMVKAILLSII
jgi:hypothetical protein